MAQDTSYSTTQKLKEQTSISQNTDVSQLEHFISVSEEMHIVPTLGTALDTELKAEIEAGSLSGNNKTLVDNYVVPASNYYTWYEASPFLSIKSMNKGLVKQFSDSSNPIDREELQDYRQAVKDKAVFYVNRLLDYLNDNKSLYPNYRASDDCDGYAKRRYSGGIFLS